MIQGVGSALLIILAAVVVLTVAHAFVWAYREEHRFAYSEHRRALRELARSNPRRKGTDA